MRKSLIALPVAAALLSGCASTMTGMETTSEYGCKAPAGVSCKSISGVYANAVQNNLPSQRSEDGGQLGFDPVQQARPRDAQVIAATLASGAPLRSQSRVLRVWIAPWEDSDGDLNDQSYSYIVVDAGKWMIDHNRRNIANEFAPVRPPTGINASNKGASASDTKPLGQIKGGDLAQ